MKTLKVTSVKRHRFHTLRDEISEELEAKGYKGMTLQEIWAVQRVLDRKEIELISDSETPSKASFLMRLTVFGYILLSFLLAVIYCPIKWVFTGRYYITSKSWVYRFMQAWSDKLE